jgi:L-lysine 2,3-aminomutase
MRISEDEDLWQLLKDFNAQKRLFLVTHFNHPREVSSESVKTLRALLKAGIIVSNQGVLLKGVNDNIDTLTQLMRTLVRQGVQPYYIFQCRPVRGIKRIFQVPLVQGIEIIEGVRKNLDGISKRFRYIMSARETGSAGQAGK